MSEKPILGILLGNSAGVGPELVAMLAVKDYYADYCRPWILPLNSARPVRSRASSLAPATRAL